MAIEKRPGDHSKENLMFVAIFDKTPVAKPCKILKFSRDETVKFVKGDPTTFKWVDPPVSKELTIPENTKDRLFNIFLVKTDKIVVVLEYKMTLLDFNLEQLNQVTLKSLNPYWTLVSTFSGHLFD